MIEVSDWLPQALVGFTFTGIGVFKLYGYARGLVSGWGAPLDRSIRGT